MRYFLSRGQNIEKFVIFWGNFPDPELADPIQPGSKKFDPDPSLSLILSKLLYFDIKKLTQHLK